MLSRFSVRKTLAVALGLYAAELALGVLSFHVVLPPIGSPAFWLSNGLAIGVLVRAERRIALAVLPAIAAAHATIFLIRGNALPPVFFWTLGDVVEVSVAALLIRRLAGGACSLGRLRDLGIVGVSAVVVGPLIGALPAGASVPWLEDTSFGQLVWVWWLTDGLGTVVTLPFVLAWTGPPWARATPRQAVLALLTALATAAVFAELFSLPEPTLRVLALSFATFPLLGWAALGHGPRGASAATVALGGVALERTLAGEGPFVGVGALQAQLFAVQGFVALCALTALVLAAVREDRRKAWRSRRILLAASTDPGAATPLSRTVDGLLAALVPELAPGAAVVRALDGRRELLASAGEAPPGGFGASGGAHGGLRAFPLAGADGELGELLVREPHGGHDPDDDELARALAERLRVALEAARLREEAELRLRRLEESLALVDTLLYRAPVGLAFLDRELRYVHVNETLAALDARPAPSYRGVPASAPGGPLWPELVRRLPEVLSSGAAVTGLETDADLPGGVRHFLCSIYPVRVGEVPPLGVGVVVLDVTRQKEAEAERLRLLAEAQEAVRVRDDFLSLASHDLKTPLTPLSIRLQLLRRRLAASQPVAPEEVDRALASLDRLTQLINDLLDASRVEAHRLAIHPEPISLRAVVRASIALLLPTVGGHELVHEEASPEPWVLGDRMRLEQVFTNLLENAVKYSPHGPRLRVTERLAGDEVIVSIADRGIGIPREQLPLLFDRFFRARNAASRSFEGLGLGLYISRDIVEHHGGRIWVESELGEGSTFHVALPLLPHPGTDEAAGAAAH